MCLAELYIPLREIISARRITELTGVIEKREKSGDFIESFREPVNAFITAAEKFLDGGKGKYIPFGEKKHKASRSKTQAAEKEWFLFLENIITAAEASAKTAAEKTAPDSGAFAIMALGYSTLTLLRSVSEDGKEAAALAAHWHLGHVIRKCWEEAGIPEEDAKRGVEIAFALLARTGTNAGEIYKTAKTPGDIAAALVLENYDSDDFRNVLGVNRFDEVTWFNKEAFEVALFLVPRFLSLEGKQAFGKSSETAKERQKRIETIESVAQAFRRAKEACGYRLDELPGALSEK